MNVVTIHICYPHPAEVFIRCDACFDCNTVTFMAGWRYENHGIEETCLRCGRSYRDGDPERLPSGRGGRAASIANAKKRWREYRKLLKTGG
jgi:Zn ribbon nucleic-acid-binding protein